MASKYLIQKINDHDSSKNIQNFMADLTANGAVFDNVMTTYTGMTNAQFLTDFKGTNGQTFVDSLSLFDPAKQTETGSILEGKTINGTTYGTNDEGIIPDTTNPIESGTMFTYTWHASTYKEALNISGVSTGAIGSGADAIRSGDNLKFQIGANAQQSLTMETYSISAQNLGLANQKLTSHEDAIVAITSFDRAISIISSARSNLGAMQNRLEHTINNLGTASENLTSAESRIRETDMAKK